MSSGGGRSLEVEVGGLGLLLAGAAVVGLCIGSFWLGRRTAPVPPLETPSAPVGSPQDVEADLTFFDSLPRAPELSVRRDDPPAGGPAPAPPEASPAAGPFEIQVLASTERPAAEAVVERLRRRGFTARIVEGEKEGAPLYRVRVGGFSDEPAARRAAEEIERTEGLRTWVIR